jgi:uncharacterized protein
VSLKFKPLEIGHKEIFRRFLSEDPPQISEMTFTNLFIWKHRYHPVWAELDDCLLIILHPDGTSPFGLQPAGKGDKKKALETLCDELKDISDDVRICRVSEDFINRHLDHDQYFYQLDRENSDYVYASKDLVELSGRKYHRKKNLLNNFIKNYQFEYLNLDKGLVEQVLDMQAGWCLMKNCHENPDLLSENYAIHTAMTFFEELDYKGAALLIGSRIEAFTLGEQLNADSAVIHIEKANPDIPGLYSAINRFFVHNTWSHLEYINREQDLGIEGLRKAKESYYPHHMVTKYTIFPR